MVEKVKTRSKILAVDDCPTNIAIIKAILGTEHRVLCASSGEEALDIAADFHPDVILLDIMMPGLDGYEVCRRLRANAVLRPTKILMVSAKALSSERLEGYAAGADDYITKPFSKDELRAKVRVYLRLKSVEEVERFRNGVLADLGSELTRRLSGILLPATLLMSGDHLELPDRKLLAELIHRNARQLHVLLDELAESDRFGRGRSSVLRA
ncbi:MAG: two-component system response regulator [Phycisphaerae bacterium]